MFLDQPLIRPVLRGRGRALAARPTPVFLPLPRTASRRSAAQKRLRAFLRADLGREPQDYYVTFTSRPAAAPGSLNLGVPTGIRTPVTAVKGRCPRPLDDGDCGTQETIDRIYATYRIKPSLQILLILSIRSFALDVICVRPSPPAPLPSGEGRLELPLLLGEKGKG